MRPIGVWQVSCDLWHNNVHIIIVVVRTSVGLTNIFGKIHIYIAMNDAAYRSLASKYSIVICETITFTWNVTKWGVVGHTSQIRHCIIMGVTPGMVFTPTLALALPQHFPSSVSVYRLTRRIKYSKCGPACSAGSVWDSCMPLQMKGRC